MFQFKFYVELLLLVSIFPIAMPQISNLSPLRGVLNTDLPDSLKTTTLTSANAGFASDFKSPIPSANQNQINSFEFPNAPSGATVDGFGGGGGGGGGGGVAFSSAGASFAAPTLQFQINTGGFGDSGPSRVIDISTDDVEAALDDAFGQSNIIRPQAGGFGSGASSGLGVGFGGGSFGGASFGSSGGFGGGSFDGVSINTTDGFVDSGPSFTFSQSNFQSQNNNGGVSGLEGTSLSHFGFRQTQPVSELDSNCIGQVLELASINVIKRNLLTPAEALINLPNVKLNEESCLKRQAQQCPEFISPFLEIPCNPNDPYRSLDGSCNNLRNPELGASFRPFNRYLHPAYEDGIREMRGENRAIPLPSARTVSAGLQRLSQKDPREDLTLLVMQWGQFLDHDLTHTAEATSKEKDIDGTPRPIECCEFGIPNFPRDPNCRGIDVSNDPLFRSLGRSCMHFVRSLVAKKGCTLGPREQLNQVTSYLDASNVYGSEDEEAKNLRTESGGLLRDSQPFSGHGTFLPRMQCPMTNEPNCFEAGDVRVNEQPVLASMHTLWLRVHNNIARELASFNPSWDDEILYQETRRIVSALHQQITYQEFLPVVLGPDFMNEFQLNLRNQGHDNSYKNNEDATIVNVFATAAFRFGHTLIDEIFKGMGRNVTLRGNFDEPLVLNNPSTGPTALLQGLTACPTRGSDAFLTPTLVNHLLSKITDPVGLDLMSLNIQRGRDHGLPPYHEWRRLCRLSPINSFEDLYRIMDPEAAYVFQASYQSVKDIDLFPAGLAENTMAGGLLGPTFSCLLAQQFYALKFGDRFFYENQNQPKPFTTGQLSALRQQSIASIMCQHLGLKSLQPKAFRSDLIYGNQLQDCSIFPRLDLRFWSKNSLYPPNPYPNPKPNPNPNPNSTQPGRYTKRPRVPCITPGTPKTHLSWFFPLCTPDLFINNN